MKKILPFFSAIILFLLIFAFDKIYAQSDLSSAVDPNKLATCLAGKKFVMYGRDGCSACALEKEYFGTAFSSVPYYDCEASAENRSVCDSKNIRAYPTWEDATGKQYKGAIPLQILAELSGCEEKIQAANTGKSLREIPQIKGFSIPLFFSSFQQSAVKIAADIIKDYGVIFLAGLISFFAPCVIPLLPSYLSIISGFTFADLYGLEFSNIRGRVFKSALFFSFGFTLLFTLLGATGLFIGQFINSQMPYLLKLSGFFLLILGLVQLHVIRIPSLEFDFAWAVQRRLTKLGFLSSGIAGITSALCWIPCVGPILATILVLSANSQSAVKGMSYLLVYSSGVMIPFLAASLFFPRFFDIYREKRSVLRFFSLAGGLIIIAFGLILIFNKYGDFINIYYSIIKFMPINWSMERLLER